MFMSYDQNKSNDFTILQRKVKSKITEYRYESILQKKCIKVHVIVQ